jgi:hypothetical protein
MADNLFAGEINDLILRLVHKRSTYHIEEWSNSLTPVEFGILSWHLGAFYYYDPLF